MKKFLFIISVFGMMFFLSWQTHQKKDRQIYQLVVYHFNAPAQEQMLDNYFENALLPALHRAGIPTVGVFKSWANDTASDKVIYVFIPMQSIGDVVKTKQQLQKDQTYNKTGAGFLNADFKQPAYTRTETILLQAFTLAPQLKMPSLQSPKKERVYELRSYESATQKKFESKVKMFNEGNEMAIFNRLRFNPIFYSEVIAGSKMPNLMYMTSFENRTERDAHWKAFSTDSAWKKLSALPEYKNNVSHIDINFLYPADYSDF